MEGCVNPDAPSLGRTITSLNPHDVLLGRGNGYSDYIGNQRFRDLTDKRKKDYNSTVHFKPKDRIAHEILDSVHANNGRFVRRVESERPVQFILEEEEWEEVSTKIAIQKTKQALRQKKKVKRARAKNAQEDQQANSKSAHTAISSVDAGISDNQEISSLSTKVKRRALAQSELGGVEDHEGWLMPTRANRNRSAEVQATSAPILSINTATGLTGDVIPDPLSPMHTLIELQALPLPAIVSSKSIVSGGVASLPASLYGRTTHSSSPFYMPAYPCNYMGSSDVSIDPRLFLYRQPHPLAVLGTSQFYDPPVRRIGIAVRDMEAQSTNEILPERLVSRPINPTSAVASGEEHNADTFSNGTTKSMTRANTYQIQEELTKLGPRRTGLSPDIQASESSNVSPPDDITEELLSMLSLYNRSTVSEKELALEKARMSRQERAETLSDLFGQMCTDHTHESKKPRLDLDKDSIEFLLCTMRSEIELVPVDKKAALIEAYTNGRRDEFSDERLLKFLRCEGMNAKLAADRFVNYWNARRDVFGPKFMERMSLAEALNDDILALEAGLFCLLPSRDTSGRLIVYVDPSRHTREGYSAESMLRAIWYVFEVACQENANVSNAVVEVIWNESSSIFDYDKELHDKLLYYHDTSWPTRCAAMHLCCSSPFVARFLRPILRALRTKTSRARSVYHDVPNTEIIRTLTDYGITAEMLPVEMGGTLNFCQTDWIAQRRSTEMKEQEIE